MKQIKNISRSLLLFSFLSLVSCQKQERVKPIQISQLYAGAGDIRVIGADFVSPFDTSISANLYYYDGDYQNEQLADIERLLQSDFHYYHALFDRHYSYYLEGEDTPLKNLYVLNQNYGTEEKVKLPAPLYDLLKKSYQFSLDSDGRFNIFLGQLNDIYETNIAKSYLSSSHDALSYSFELTSNLHFASFDQETKNKIEVITKSIPHTKEEMEGLLTFDDASTSVTFHAYRENKNLAISLGGNAKGYTTELIAKELEEKYPNISLLINSGFSSIKAIGKRPDDVTWKIRYDNPSYYELVDPSISSLSKTEVKLEAKDSFSLSTSGYYNQYFYEYQEGSILRRSHIINSLTGYSLSTFDQVSLLSDDAFYADMMTTALMNTSSVDEALTIFKRLKAVYQKEDDTLIFCCKTKPNTDSLFTYSIDDFKNLSSTSLPVSILLDGKEYQGDYSDISYSDIKEVKSKFSPSFEESYYVYGPKGDNLSLLKNAELSGTSLKRNAVIKKLS